MKERVEVQMLTARNLNFGTRPAPEGQIQEWMWNGAAIAEALHGMFPEGTATVGITRAVL